MRSPSIRFSASLPFRGKSNTLSCAGWLSEIGSLAGSKTEASWALVTVKGAESARKANKRYSGRNRPILIGEERVKRRTWCMWQRARSSRRHRISARGLVGAQQSLWVFAQPRIAPGQI